MTHAHYTPFTLSVDLAEEPIEPVVESVLRCRECRDALEELNRWLASLDHFDPLVAPEYETRHEFFEQLFAEHQTYSARLAAVELDDLYHHWGLARLVLERSEEGRSQAARGSLELAELAMKIATALDPVYYHPCWVADLCALAAGNLADAHRVCREYDVAEEYLRLANDWQLSGTSRPRIGRKLGRLHALLLRDQGNYLEALDRLDQELAAHEQSETEGEENFLHWFFRRWPASAGSDGPPGRDFLRRPLGD